MGTRILVADSDNTIQQVAMYFLDLEGFDVRTASDGITAMEEIEKFSPEIILIDPELKGINGIEVSKLLKEKPEYQDISVLFLSNEEASIPEGYDMICKPIDPTRMIDTINKNLKERQQPEQESPSEKDESVKIEELLGWSVAQEAEEKNLQEREEEPLPEETVMIESSEDSGEDVLPDAVEIAGNGADYSVVADIGETEGSATEAVCLSEKEDPEVLSDETVNTVNEVADMTHETTIEEDVRSMIHEEMIRDIIGKISGEVIEKIAREMVPEIAEREVKREIARLKGESE